MSGMVSRLIVPAGLRIRGNHAREISLRLLEPGTAVRTAGGGLGRLLQRCQKNLLSVSPSSVQAERDFIRVIRVKSMIRKRTGRGLQGLTNTRFKKRWSDRLGARAGPDAHCCIQGRGIP